MTLTYSLSPGFAAMEGAQLSADFYGFLSSIVPNPGNGMWYASTQSFGNRIEAIALAVGADCLLVAKGVQPMRRDGSQRTAGSSCDGLARGTLTTSGSRSELAHVICRPSLPVGTL